MSHKNLNNPLVTVIVPSFNHAAFLKDCIGSVLAQTYQNIELIVIDDGSSDSSPELIKSLSAQSGFHFVLNANQGLCRTINQGLRISRGELIVVFASDDRMPPSRIQEQVLIFCADSELSVAAGAMDIIDENGVVTGMRRPWLKGRIQFWHLIFRNFISAPTAMSRRSAIEALGGYDENFAIEDISMWLALTYRKMKIVNFSNVWAQYRVIDRQSDKKLAYYHTHLLKILKSYENKYWLVPVAIFAIRLKFFLRGWWKKSFSRKVEV